MVNPQDLLPSSRHAKVYDLDSAIKFIEAGNTPETHRYLYDGHLYAYKQPDGSVTIAPGWDKTRPLLTYLKDDVVIIGPFANGHIPQSYKRKVAYYGNLYKLSSNSHRLLVTLPNAKITKNKEVKCRSCSGMKRHVFMCDGNSNYRTITTGAGKQISGWFNCTQNNSTNTHREMIDCGYCRGTGKVSWGGKPIPMEWEVTKPLRMKIVTGEILEEDTTN